MILINFVPLTKYKFNVEIDLNGAAVSNIFTIIVEINKEVLE